MGKVCPSQPLPLQCHDKHGVTVMMWHTVPLRVRRSASQPPVAFNSQPLLQSIPYTGDVGLKAALDASSALQSESGDLRPCDIHFSFCPSSQNCAFILL